MKAAGPVVQALVLMMFVLSLPLLAFFSMFDLNTMVRLTVVHFSVVFWTFYSPWPGGWITFTGLATEHSERQYFTVLGEFHDPI